MVKEMKNFVWLYGIVSYRNLVILLSIILTLIPIYFLLLHYWPVYKAHSYYESISFRLASLERGDLPFFIERQRRSIFELSRSVYMQNLITYKQGQSEITEQQMLKMESFIQGYKQYFGYKQVLLLDNKGTFVFSTKPALRGKSIYDEAYKKGLLLPSYRLVSMTLTSDITPFSYSPVLDQKAIMITMPVFFEGALNGILAVQLDNGEIEKLLSLYASLRSTEESLIVQRIEDVITFVVPPVSQPNLVLPVRSDINRNVGAPVERAALGYEGYGVCLDHRGVLIVAAWYFLPQLNWGFVVKTDYTNVVQYIHWFGYVIIFFAVLALFFILFLLLDQRDKKLDERKNLPPADISL